MYSPAFQTIITDARIEDLRRARGISMQPHRSGADSNPRPAARSGLLSRVRIRRPAFADPSRAN
jgi:hypothetical protein